MRRNIVFTGVVVLSALTAFGAATNRIRKVRTPEERQEFMRQLHQRRTGGIVREPGSAKGVFVVLNVQKRVSADALGGMLKYMDETLHVRSKAVDAEAVDIARMGELVVSAGGTVGVGLVDDPALPTILTAPESRWSVVNVAKIAENCADDATLASRVRKEILRSLAFMTGCAYMTMGDPLMRDVMKPGDLDGLRSECFGIEILNRFSESAALYGLKPWHVATYRTACEEGWAPAPTNDVQKVIWNRVHAPPSKPIKITYDKAAQKPVVK